MADSKQEKLFGGFRLEDATPIKEINLDKCSNRIYRLPDNSEILVTRMEKDYVWSKHSKQRANTEMCDHAHLCLVKSGRLCVKLNDSSEMHLKAGDVAFIPKQHDSFVEGDEPCEIIDFR